MSNDHDDYREPTRLEALRDTVSDKIENTKFHIQDGATAYRRQFSARPVMTILATIGAIYVGYTMLTRKDRFMEDCMVYDSRSQCEAEWEHYEDERELSYR